jgi:hypothetical protein
VDRRWRVVQQGLHVLPDVVADLVALYAVLGGPFGRVELDRHGQPDLHRLLLVVDGAGAGVPAPGRPVSA